MKQFIKSLFTDEVGASSSKRLMGILACLVLYGVAIGVMIFKLPEPSSVIINAIVMIALGCLGLSSVDKFSKK